MDRLVAQDADGMVIILGCLVNPLPFIKLVNGIRQVPFHHACTFRHAPHHIFQDLSCLNHHKIIFFSYN